DRISALNARQASDDVLAGGQRPFALPFEYQQERIRQLLLLLKTLYRDMYTSFAPQVDVDRYAADRLGLSPERGAMVIDDHSRDLAALRNVYGLAPDEDFNKLAQLERFRRATGLDGPTLRQLLFGQLSQLPGGDGKTERASAGLLFINNCVYVAPTAT